MVASIIEIQGQGEGFEGESLYTIFVQIGAHPRFLLEWLLLPVCKNYVFARQIAHLDCLWSPKQAFGLTSLKNLIDFAKNKRVR